MFICTNKGVKLIDLLTAIYFSVLLDEFTDVFYTADTSLNGAQLDAAIVEAFVVYQSAACAVWIASGAEPNWSNRLYQRLKPTGLWTVHRWVKEMMD